MKAITPVVSLILLMLITVGLIGASYTWLSGITTTQTSNTFKVTPINGNKIIVTNLGTTEIDTNNLDFFAGSGDAGISNPTKIQAGKAAILEIIPRGYGKISGKVVSPAMSFDFTIETSCAWNSVFDQNDIVRFRWHNDCAEDGGAGLSNINGGPTCTGCNDPTLTGITIRDKDGNAIGSWSGSLQTGDSLVPKIENRFIDLTITQASSNGPFYAEFSFTGLTRPQDQQFWLYSVNGDDKRTYIGDILMGTKLQIPCSKTFACINSITAGSTLKIRTEHKSGGDYDNDLQAICTYTEDTDDFTLSKVELLDKDDIVLAVNTTVMSIADVSNGVNNFDAYDYYLTVTQSSSNSPFKIRMTTNDLGLGNGAEFDLIMVNDGFVGYVGDIAGSGSGVTGTSVTSIC
ncbi:MAG: hypothetical protein V1836_01180 [Candidatus Aenigmatarchaeota archaeon]